MTTHLSYSNPYPIYVAPTPLFPLDLPSSLKEIFGAKFEDHASEQMRLIKRISEHIESIHAKVEKMVNARKEANKITDVNSGGVCQ